MVLFCGGGVVRWCGSVAMSRGMEERENGSSGAYCSK